MSTWNLLFQHRFDEAKKLYEQKIRNDPGNPDLLSAHAHCLLGLKQYGDALIEFQRANDLGEKVSSGKSSPHVETISGRFWILGHRQNAIAYLSKAIADIENGVLKFTDNAGGAIPAGLLFSVAVFSDNEIALRTSIDFLSRIATSEKRTYWPGPIASLLTGLKPFKGLLFELTGKETLENAVDFTKPHRSSINRIASALGLDSRDSRLLAGRRLVQAIFYQAVLLSKKGDKIGCRKLMANCAGLPNPVIEIEWYIAQHESLVG